MKVTRLFHTLIVCGAALTGGAATTVVAALTLEGCGSSTHSQQHADLGYDFGYPEIDQGIPIDFATPPDLDPGN